MRSEVFNWKTGAILSESPRGLLVNTALPSLEFLPLNLIHLCMQVTHPGQDVWEWGWRRLGEEKCRVVYLWARAPFCCLSFISHFENHWIRWSDNVASSSMVLWYDGNRTVIDAFSSYASITSISQGLMNASLSRSVRESRTHPLWQEIYILP